jgi:catechol-2,3-dioxygenase
MIEGIFHIGIQSDDPTTLAAFYCEVLDMQVVGGSEGDPMRGTSVFLSNNPAQERHHLAIFQRHELAHTAFRVDSLAELLERYRRMIARGIPIKRVTNSGASFAFFFDDPDGNMIEVYWPTGRECRQPYSAPLDLTQPEEALLREADRFPMLAGAHGEGAD